jgi:hypothetical protein
MCKLKLKHRYWMQILDAINFHGVSSARDRRAQNIAKYKQQRPSYESSYEILLVL